MVTASVSQSSISELEADAIVVALRPSAEGPVLARSERIGDDVADTLEALFRTVGATTGPGDCTVLPAPTSLLAKVVLGVSLGPARPDLHPSEVLRRAAGAAARAARQHGHLAFAFPVDGADDVVAVLEGGLLGGYSYDEFRTSTAKPAKTTKVTVLADASQEAVSRAETLAQSVAFCRDLVNTPPGSLRPSAFAERVADALAPAGLEVEILDADRLGADGSGGILGVGQGSSDAPLLIRIAYRHSDAQSHLALVGKGITFDSGGLSLKPPKSMETMKCDMSGAAAVAATLLALARLGSPVNVTGWLAVAENMPGGSAQRPGDVIRMYGGKTVEVLNTDAEGRLVLGDALVRAAQDEPDAIIDIATLTGAQVVALGSTTAGVMGNDDALRTRICRVGQQAGEALWPMPLPPELRPSLDSPIADLANVGDRTNGGMLTAGLFLQEFVPAGTPWGHIDIAGPAFNTAAAYGYTPKGGTGFGVRTLVAVAESLAPGSLS